MMKLPYVILDVFTTTRYKGNPLAIVIVPLEFHSVLSQSQKQNIASEFNLSETVFAHKNGDSESFSIDIFTPYQELPFAGHPTIGTAVWLFNYAGESRKALKTKAGPIPISLSAGGKVTAKIPHNMHIHPSLSSALSIDKTCPVVSIVKGMTFILVQVKDLEILGTMKAGIECNLDDLDEGWREGFYGTYFYVDQGTDLLGRRSLRTRMIQGWEDPATGSAASALCCYLALQVPLPEVEGPIEFAITQGVEMGRRSEIGVQVGRTGSESRINSIALVGAAVKVMEGGLEID